MVVTNLINAGINENTGDGGSAITLNASELANLSISERALVFTKVSVTPTIRNNGFLTNSKSFIEIRKKATLASDIAGAAIGGSFHNRLYPSSATISVRAKNKEETKPFRIKTFDSDENESDTNRKFSYTGTNQMDLENFDYFILINPEVVLGTEVGDTGPGEFNTTTLFPTTAVRPHFARITSIIGIDEFGDGIEFEPPYPTTIPKDTNFEIYKGPSKTDTDVVAVSYGLEGDDQAQTHKYEVVNTISIPTAYFYNERLHEDNQLDYETKYAFLFRQKNATNQDDSNCWFLTEPKFDRTIQNLGRKTLDAILVDKTKNDATDYSPLVQDGFLNDFYRDNAHDVRRYIYFDKREFKNNRVPTTMEITTNAPKNRISKLGTVKFTDNSGIAHLKYLEEDQLYIRNGIYNSSIQTVKSPYNATHSAGNVIEILDMGDEYDVKALLSTNSMLEIDGYHYIVNSIAAKAGGTQNITTKARKLVTANTFTSTNTVHEFTNKEVRYAPFTISSSSKHRLNTTFASDTKIKVDQSDRITLDERTIAKENTIIHNSKLSTANNTSFYIDLEKGDEVHKYLEFANNTTNYYQSDYPFMYYLSGGYTLHETVFNGFVEDVKSENEQGLLSYHITGRDEIGDLLSTNITKNLNFTNDIVYSTSNPTVESAISNFTAGTIASSGNIAVDDTTFVVTDSTLSINIGDLVYNKANSTTAGDLIGEVLSFVGTTVTLANPALNTTTSSEVLFYSDTKHISGLKALKSNTLETTRTTDYTSISGKGLVYSTGKDISGNSLVSTSDSGSYSKDGSLGYHISRTNLVSGDSTHLLSVGLDDGFESTVSINRTFNTESLAVVGIENIDDNNNTVRLAPTLPVVMGRLDSGKFYHVNTNIPLGGYLHKLVNASKGTPKSEELYRFYNANRFNPGTLNYAVSSIYSDASNINQKISGYSDLIHYNNDVSGIDTSYTTSSNSASALTANIATGSNFVPKEIWDGSNPRGASLSDLTQVDRRTIPYELYGLGDILPFSFKRTNSLGRAANGMNNFGLMFEDDSVGTGSEITHTNYTEKTKYITKSDRNYEFSTISESNIDTNQMRRWGVMRLVEATFDWHFNSIDAESIPDTSEIAKVRYPIYHRYSDRSPLDATGFDVTANGSNITIASRSFVAGDALYLEDGQLIAVFNGSITTTSININDSQVVFVAASKIGSGTKKAKVRKINFSRIIHDDADGLNGNDDAVTNTFEYIDNFTEVFTNGRTLQTLIDVHHLVPRIDRDYLEYENITDFDPPNVLLPFFARFDSAINFFSSSINSDSNPSLYPVNRMADVATNEFIHTSRVLHAILHTKPDFTSHTYVSHGLTHYKFSGGAHLYQNCRLTFTDFKSGLARTNSKDKPTMTSSDVESKNYTGSDSINFSAIASYYPSQTLFTVGYGVPGGAPYNLGSNDIKTFVAPMTRTKKFVNQQVANSYTATADSTPTVTNNDGDGQIYRSQMFVKPVLTITGSSTNSVQKTMNSGTDALWLDFTPNLTGYYLVFDTNDTTNRIAKITNHTIDESGTHREHTLTLDKSLAAGDYRLMRVSETTFDETPDKIEFNKFFDTGLQYDKKIEDIRYSRKRDRKSEYQEGILSMFLFVDIDNLDSTNHIHIDRRNMANIDDIFTTNGEQIQVYVTDGKTRTEKTVTINTSNSDFSMKYDGKLSGDGLVSFGEIFNVVIPKRLNIRPTNAYLGTTFSIGSEVDLEISDILKEIDLDIDSEQSLREYTGAIVNAGNASSTTITYTGTTDIAVDDVLYTHEGFLLGKVSNITSDTITFDSKEFVPAIYDEIIRRNKRTFITLANFEDVDAFSVINYLASKKALDYTIENKKMIIKRLDDSYGLRSYQLDYLTNNNITHVESNKSLFDKANKVIVIGDGVRAETEIPTTRRTREVVIVEPNIKSLNDARIKAEQTLRTLQSDAKKIKIQLHKEGLELIKPGDIVSLDFPNHNIPKADYQVFEIENSLTSLLTLSVNTFNKSIAERLSELGVEQKIGFSKILSQNSEQEIVGKLFFDTVNINNISVKYQVSRNENALGFNNTLGFNSQLGLDITDDTPHITERDE